MSAVPWPARHPVQFFIGRSYHLFGGGARRIESRWRYPVTWAVYRVWRWWHRA